MPSDEFRIVFMTAGSADEAATIARALVEEGLAACVNIVPACRSVYRWEGKVVDDDEVMLIAKTSAAKFKTLEKRVSRLHSYDVPEIIAVRLADLSDGYRAFLDDVLGS